MDTATLSNITLPSKEKFVSNHGESIIDLEQRTLIDRGLSVPFNFLVVNDHSKWLPATAFTTTYNISRPNSNKQLRFPVRPISLGEWENVEYDIPLPNVDIHPSDPQNSEPTESGREARELVFAKRKAVFLETVTGITFPGDTLDAKVASMNTKRKGDVDALYDYLTEQLSGFNDGTLLDTFNNLSFTASSSEVSDVKDFSDWEDAASIELIFRHQRPTDKYITEFPLKGLSAQDKKSLDEEVKYPVAPKIPARTPDGRFDPTKLIDDINDHRYKQLVRQYHRRRIVILIQSVLIFQIPGMTIDEKYDWLSQRVIGDVVKLRDFVEQQVISYRRHFDSFI